MRTSTGGATHLPADTGGVRGGVQRRSAPTAEPIVCTTISAEHERHAQRGHPGEGGAARTSTSTSSTPARSGPATAWSSTRCWPRPRAGADADELESVAAEVDRLDAPGVHRREPRVPAPRRDGSAGPGRCSARSSTSSRSSRCATAPSSRWTGCAPSPGRSTASSRRWAGRPPQWGGRARVMVAHADQREMGAEVARRAGEAAGERGGAHRRRPGDRLPRRPRRHRRGLPPPALTRRRRTRHGPRSAATSHFEYGTPCDLPLGRSTN